ncbi:MAG: diaminopimelate decarboxylase [Spirochaetales bacterium]|jgi:diaminopimelate decarboxylase|nr:diaminopimelate decarboxylase [Spirochaetales bacterium]
MENNTLPFTKERLESITEEYPTPFHIYDEAAIRRTAKDFVKAFAWVNGGFTNYYAVKALPNPYILDIVRQEGMGADCSSLPELLLAQAAGITGEQIMFSSNDTPATEYAKARELGAIINLDDITHIEYLDKNAGLPELICIRYNPGPLKEGNAIIGEPQEAKYGFTREQVIEGYRILKEKGVKRFGLHTMVASNELNPEYFVETAAILFDLVSEITEKTGARIEFVNLGGGVGIPYNPGEKAVDMALVSEGVKKRYSEKIEAKGLAPIRVVMECGRMVTGPHGYLVSRVLHKKETYKSYVGLDSCMANLMRPGMYGAHHHITVPGKENSPLDHVYDVSGSLCENNDKFAIDRKLPEIEIGDLIVIHNSGAHGHSMGFNYNGKLRSAELLLKKDGSVKQIRRAETAADYFATVNYPGLKAE